MSVRKRKWRDKQGRQHTRWMVHIEHTWPDGRKQTIRKVSPVQTKRGAEQYERELRTQLVSGQWKEGAKKQVPTLKEFAGEFLAYQATLNKPNVIVGKESMMRVHLLPAFGKKRLDQIDERAIDAYTVSKLEHVTPRGKVISPVTINHHLRLLGRVLNVARKWKLIREVPEIQLLKTRKSGFDFLTFEEADAFLAAAAEHMPEWLAYMTVAIRTGLRVGEMVALRWREDIDLERGRLRVQQSHSRKHGFSSTKNDKTRQIPLTWDACEALRVQQAKTGDGELVFVREDNGGVLNSGITTLAIEKIAAHAELRRIHNHVLRHTFASHAVMRGIPIRQVQEWLGHSSITMTMRYSHLSSAHGDEMIQRLAPGGPAREDGSHSRRGGARSQHMGGTGNPPTSKSPPQPV